MARIVGGPSKKELLEALEFFREKKEVIFEISDNNKRYDGYGNEDSSFKIKVRVLSIEVDYKSEDSWNLKLINQENYVLKASFNTKSGFGFISE